MRLARDARRSSALIVRALLAREAGERLVEQQHARLLRERHRDLDAPLLAVGHLGDRPLRRCARGRRAARTRARLVVELLRAARRTRSSARCDSPSSDERDVVLERVLREERDDLVGAREAAMRAPVRRQPADFLAEEADRCRHRAAGRR